MINCPPNASYRMTNVQRCIYFSAIIYIYICVCVCVCEISHCTTDRDDIVYETVHC